MADEVGRMQVVLGADTVKHDAALEKSAEVAGASSKAMKKAAQDAADAQARAAKYAADEVTEQGSRILAARKLLAESLQSEKAIGRDIAKQRVDEATGSTALTAAIQREVIARKELAAAMALGKEASHGSFSDQMAASAAVRELGGNGGIRSVERFLTIIPGVGSALRTLFPIIGAVGLAGLLVDMGVKGYEAFEKIRNAARDAQRAFDEMDAKERVQIDDLEIENQKIQDQIDKLSGRPNNGLATALLEAKKMADQLLVSLEEDRKQIEAIFKEHSVGPLQSILTDVASTRPQEKNILRDEDTLESSIGDINDKFDIETTGVKDKSALKAATERRNQAVREAIQSQIDNYKREVARLHKEEADSQQAANDAANSGEGSVAVAATDNSAKIQEMQNVIRHLQRRGRVETLNEDIYAGNTTLGGLKQNKGSGSDNKAAEDQMKGFEAMLSKRKQDEQLAVVDEINFWEAMLVPAQKYEQNVEKINERLGALTQAYYRQLDQIAAKAVEAQKRAAEQMQQQDAQMLSMMKQWEAQDSRRATSQAKLAEAQKRVADGIAEQAIQFQVMTGQLSRHDAALQMAAIHAADFRAQLEELDREAAEDAQRSTLTPDERETRANDRDIRRVNITGEANRTAVTDQQQIENTTATGAATDALREFTAAALDSSRQIHEFISSTINDVNEAILSGKKGSFRQAGSQILKGGEKSLLQEAEGQMLKALGITDPNKKPKGTATDPVYVKQVGAGASGGESSGDGISSLLSSFGGDGTAGKISSAVSGGAGTAISGIGGMLEGLGGDSSTASTIASSVAGGASDVGSGISSFFSGLGDLAFFADGTGPLTADTHAIVGERGPELVHLPRGASVTPNNKLPKMSGDTHVYNIDATGSTDPAQTEASVHRVMQQYVPGIVQASVGATRDAALRRPRTSY